MVYWGVSHYQCFPMNVSKASASEFADCLYISRCAISLNIFFFIVINLSSIALHFDTAANHKRIKLFWSAFTGMFIYEIIPAYIFPSLNGFNIFCLSSQHAPSHLRDVFTNLFGGATANEGLGFLSLSFDWQYIGATYGSPATP